MKRISVLVPIALVATLGTQTGHAQLTDLIELPDSELQQQDVIVNFWTTQLLDQATPLEAPQTTDIPSAAVSGENAATGAAMGELPAATPGQPPDEGAAAGAGAQQIYTPAPIEGSQEEAESQPGSTQADLAPAARGTSGANYTSSRVFPLFTGPFAPYSADRAYPYRTVGKLYFRDHSNRPRSCTAAVIERRIVLTAGHCVHSGTSRGFYSYFLFVPAYRDGSAPYGVWPARSVITTRTWSIGGGNPFNSGDYAVVEFHDRRFPANGPFRRLGDVTGSLGTQTRSLANNHTSHLGYTENLDRAQRMQIITSNSFGGYVRPSIVRYGSDARTVSGWPFVQNFGERAAGGGQGQNTAPNTIVGVGSSYRQPNFNLKIQYATELDNRFTNIRSRICRRDRNCTPN